MSGLDLGDGGSRRHQGLGGRHRGEEGTRRLRLQAAGDELGLYIDGATLDRDLGGLGVPVDAGLGDSAQLATTQALAFSPRPYQLTISSGLKFSGMLRARQRSAICLAALATILAASSWVPPDRVVGWLVDAGELLREVSEPVGGDAVGVGPSRASRGRRTSFASSSRSTFVMCPFSLSMVPPRGSVEGCTGSDAPTRTVAQSWPKRPRTRSRSHAGRLTREALQTRLVTAIGVGRRRASPPLARSGGLEVPSSNLGTPTS